MPGPGAMGAAQAGVPLATRGAPMSYLTTFGPSADPATALTWGLLIISILVVAIIAGLVLVGVWKRRSGVAPLEISAAPVARRGEGVRWIWIGVSISTVFLVASAIWTVAVLGAVAKPTTRPTLTIAIIGHQWWWQARYLSPDPGAVFETANELHIPTGRPVRLLLMSSDVIHSFWVPELAGKTDTIPGRTNVAWLEASRPGAYRGQCTEYCGQQHAHMAVTVFADPPERFEAWRRAQLASAPEPATLAENNGRSIVTFRCGACHTIRGTDAGGHAGPDLTHLMSRTQIAAGAAPNTPAGLSGWVANPQGIKPGTPMPTLYLSGPELADVRAYLLTLR